MTESNYMNIWEVEQNFKCPVVGAMLSEEKHRDVLKKCGYDVRKLKSYECHRIIMEKLNDKNNVSVKVNNFIRNQARKCMARIDGMPEPELRKIWKEHLASGNVGPMMYAIIAHQDTSMQMLSDVSGEVHMKSHANMTEMFTVRQQLSKSEDTVKREQKKRGAKTREIRDLVKHRKTDARTITRLSDENRLLKLRMAELESRLDPKNDSGPAVRRLEAEIRDLRQALENEKEIARVLEREKKGLQIDLFSAQSDNDLIREQFQYLISGFDTCEGPDCPDAAACPGPACPQYKLCAKRIFMIGGITKMKAFYKDIVEKAGGEFDYHDGYLKNGNANLEANVRRSDLVICPVNCNSHNACLKIKKLCNRYNTELKMLSSSSLSAVSRALFTPQEAAAREGLLLN